MEKSELRSWIEAASRTACQVRICPISCREHTLVLTPFLLHAETPRRNRPPRSGSCFLPDHLGSSCWARAASYFLHLLTPEGSSNGHEPDRSPLLSGLPGLVSDEWLENVYCS